MTAPATNPLSYNAYVQTIGSMAVATVQETSGVYSFVDAPLQQVLPQMLNYAELRVQRDVDLLQARSANQYTAAASATLLQIPINDFLTVETIENLTSGDAPMTPVSRELIQNCYSGTAGTTQSRFFAMYGDTFGDGGNTNINILLGPACSSSQTFNVTGIIRLPSLAQFASAGPADTSYTFISEFLPDLLVMASMIFISAFQRNFSADSDDPNMGQTYEKQYKALLAGALGEENRRKQMGSAWTAYSTPPTATPGR
jgi:hypothetical protein